MNDPTHTNKVPDFTNLNQNLTPRKPSISLSIEPELEPEVNANSNYDAEAVTSYPKRNFMCKVRNNVTRAIHFMSKSDPNQHNSYGEYPFGDQYRFRDWDTW